MAIPYLDVEDKTDDVINSTYHNIIDTSNIRALQSFRDDILYIARNASSDSPLWLRDSLNNLATRFLDLFPKANEPTQKINVHRIYEGLTYDTPSEYNLGGRLYSIPILKSFVDMELIKDHLPAMSRIANEAEDAVNNTLTMKSELEALKEQSKELIAQTEASLAIINKQVGKIGVQLYADIFDRQALEHSNLFRSKGTDGDKDLGWGFGKAQVWVCLAVIFISATVSLFLQLDNIFPVNGGNEYTPEVTLHIIGRIVTISMGIFLVSFAFKQFRVNMHLYTLNKHRANTLKSFEYLSKAPDKLDPASYNAILMKVAESIYDAGQTGYITSADSNNDMPSIIDMTKIINPQSK